MNSRGQSALEYLMTYGWALIVIAIVIGILFVVFTGATSAMTCTVQSGNIVVADFSVTANDADFVIQNGEGRQITLTTVAGQGFGSTNPTYSNTSTVKSGGTTTLNNTATLDISGDVDANVAITYTVSGGLTKTAVIKCNGRI